MAFLSPLHFTTKTVFLKEKALEFSAFNSIFSCSANKGEHFHFLHGPENYITGPGWKLDCAVKTLRPIPGCLGTESREDLGNVACVP